jgi:hypothetical protein
MLPKAAAPRPGFSLGFRVQSARLVSGIAVRFWGMTDVVFKVQGFGFGV